MKLNGYVIFDTKAACTPRPPFFMGADGEATRLFTDLCANAETDMGKHPEDYSIHRVGVYDNNTMVLVPENPECLMTGVQAVAESQQVLPGSLKDVSAGGSA